MQIAEDLKTILKVFNKNIFKVNSMKTSLSDTDQKVEKVLIDIIKQKSISERLKQMEYLTSLVVHLSKRAIARNNIGKDKLELDLLFVELHYGEELSNKVHRHLIKISYEKE